MCIIVRLYACGDYRWQYNHVECTHSLPEDPLQRLPIHQIMPSEQKCTLCQRIVVSEHRYRRNSKDLVDFTLEIFELPHVITSREEYDKIKEERRLGGWADILPDSIPDHVYEGDIVKLFLRDMCCKIGLSLLEDKKLIDKLRSHRQNSLMGYFHEKKGAEHTLQTLTVIKFRANEMRMILIGGDN